MAGIVTYEIAPPADRAFELGKFVASAAGDASLAGPVSEKDFGAFVARVIGSLDAVARSSSDDGTGPSVAGAVAASAHPANASQTLREPARCSSPSSNSSPRARLLASLTASAPPSLE